MNSERPRFHRTRRWLSRATDPITLFTLFLAVLAGIQAWILDKTDHTLKDTLEANRRAQRAFVSAQIGQSYLSPNALNPQHFNVLVTFTNNGSVATQRLRLFTKCLTSTTRLDEPWVLIDQGRTEGVPVVVGPKNSTTAGCSFRMDDVRAFASDPPKLFGYILVDVSYLDGLTDLQRKTQLAQVMQSAAITEAKIGGTNEPAQVFFIWGSVGKHNCADSECPLRPAKPLNSFGRWLVIDWQDGIVVTS